MHRLENELRNALRRKPAPSGFAERVQSRVESETPARSSASRRLLIRGNWALAASVVLAVAIGVGYFAHQRRIRSRNDAALHQTLTALSIAAKQLERAETRAFSRVIRGRLDGQAAGVR
jgi:negative regulator of sigma E activity